MNMMHGQMYAAENQKTLMLTAGLDRFLAQTVHVGTTHLSLYRVYQKEVNSLKNENQNSFEINLGYDTILRCQDECVWGKRSIPEHVWPYLAHLHFCLTHKNSHRVIIDCHTPVIFQLGEDMMLIYLIIRDNWTKT